MDDVDEGKPARGLSAWGGIISATSSPLRLFTLVVLICNSLFGVVAALLFGEKVFIYTLHTFLAVVGAFSMIALWSPHSFYGPAELAQIIALEKQNDDGRPLFSLIGRLVPTVVGLLGLLIYTFYQGFK